MVFSHSRNLRRVGKCGGDYGTCLQGVAPSAFAALRKAGRGHLVRSQVLPSVSNQHPRLAAAAVAGDPLVSSGLADGIAEPRVRLSPFIVYLEEVADLYVNPVSHPVLEDGYRLLDDAAGAVVYAA